jgi:hypothetical protein
VGKRIAIVGGGIAGIYSAWRLLQQNKSDSDKGHQPAFTVHIYESQDEMGGRIRSEKIPATDFSAELGAMRFRPSHKLLNALLAKLGIPKRSFELPPPAFYLRGCRLTASEVSHGRCGSCQAESPFHLRESERGRSAVELINYAIESILGALNFPTLSQRDACQLKRRITQKFFDTKTWDGIKRHGTYQGIPLYGIGFWNLLQHFLSNEAYVMVHDVLSLESILGNWNAAEAIQWFLADFASDQFDMVPGGLSRVATRLNEDIDKEKAKPSGGIDTNLGRRVTRLDFSEGSWTVFHRSENNKDKEEEKEEPGYDDVILALPKSALLALKVFREGRPDDRWPLQWMNWVKGHRMFKLFLLYEEPWWVGDHIPGHCDGRVFTDLPLRQIYYFSPTWIRTHGFHGKPAAKAQATPEAQAIPGEDSTTNARATPGEDLTTEARATPGEGLTSEAGATPEEVLTPEERAGLSLIMASYSDEHYVSFWEPMLKPDPAFGLNVEPGPPYLRRSPKIDEKIWKEIVEKPPKVLAKRRMVEKAHPLLSEIHGREIPQPILGVERDWEAGWHTWIVGSKPWEKEIREERVRPLENLYLCGEAYSTEHGWIEGALKSAEQVLKALGVDRPEWLQGVSAKDLRDYIES